MEATISVEELEKWLKWRTFPSTRANADELLKALGLNAFNRWAIVRKTHGVMADDEIWLRFKGETLKHKDVCLRKWLYYPEDGDKGRATEPRLQHIVGGIPTEKELAIHS